MSIPKDNVWTDNTCYMETEKEIHRTMKDTVEAENILYRTGPIRAAFLIAGKKNITLDFQGAVLTLHGRIQPFIFKNCENVTLKNVTVRYARSPFTETEVEAAENDRLYLRVSDAFPWRAEDGELIVYGEDWENAELDSAPMFFQFFDGKTRQGSGIYHAIYGKNPKLNPALPWAKNVTEYLAAEENGLLCLQRKGGAPLPKAKKGDHAVITHEKRWLSGVRMECCKFVRLENVRIVNGFGMGIFPFHCENILIDGLRMTCDSLSPGFVTNAADGIHAFACSGDFVIRNSVVEGTIDDALNVHSNYYTVKQVSGNTITASTRLEPQEYTPLFLPGDRIRLHRGFTMEDTGEYILTDVRPAGEKLVEMVLDREAGNHRENDLIENMSTQCCLHIENCRFGKANTHLRFQTRGGVVIENCETELPFLLTGDSTYWFESSPCETFTVRNTRFTHPRACVRAVPEFEPTPKAPFYHGEIRIEGCSFVTDEPVFADKTERIAVRDCRREPDGEMVIRAKDCGTVDTDCCRVNSGAEAQEQAGPIRMTGAGIS